MISELRNLRRVKRDPRAADATFRAIVGKPERAGWFRRFGWQACAALLAMVLVVPAAVDLASGHDPLTSVRGTVGKLTGATPRAAATPPPATPVPPASVPQAPAAPPDAAPAAEIAPESRAAAIEQAPASAPAVRKRYPQTGTPSWLLKRVRNRVGNPPDNPFRLGF